MMMNELSNPFTVDFPLRGEWIAANTPAERIPSHGTDSLGQRYAFDFFRTDFRNGLPFFKGPAGLYYACWISVKHCYCWDEPVYAPFDAEVVALVDGLKDPRWLHPVIDLSRVIKNMIKMFIIFMFRDPHKISLHPYLGNYIILKHQGVFAFFAHLRSGSVSVTTRQTVKRGERLGNVGHTGNSTAPHLHFHLMNSPDLLTAKGIPCAFHYYEMYDNGRWFPVNNGIPEFNKRFRFAGSDQS
jgi:hypothetical protein